MRKKDGSKKNKRRGKCFFGVGFCRKNGHGFFLA